LQKIKDILSQPLASLIDGLCSYRASTAYRRGLSRLGREDINISTALKQFDTTLKSDLQQLPGAGVVVVMEILNALKTVGELSIEELPGYLNSFDKEGFDNKIYAKEQKIAQREHSQMVLKLTDEEKKERKRKKQFDPVENAKFLDAKDFYSYCLAGLKGSLAQVMALRYSPSNNKVATLEEVGLVLKVTRERVRQIESKANKVLYSTLFSEANEVLALCKDNFLASLFGDRFRLNDHELSSSFKKQPIEIIFLINVFFGGLREWSVNHLNQVNGVFVKSNLNVDLLISNSNKVTTFLGSIKLPCSVALVSELSGFSVDEINQAVQVNDKFNIYNGYVLENRLIGIRIKRCIRAHELMTRLVYVGNRLTPIDIYDFCSEYRSRYLDDDCNSRDLEIVFYANQHLFLKMYEYGWLPLNVASTRLGIAQMNQNESSDSRVGETSDVVEEVSIRNHLESILVKKITRFDDLRKQFMNLTNGQFSKASVGPVLINNQDRFVRYAPSLYGVREKQQDEIYFDAGKVELLEDSQCEIYCLSSRAGVGVGAYLLWDVDMEYRWAVWLAHHKKSRLMSSLLSVVNPENWNCPDWEKTRWIAEKKQHQHFDLIEKNRFKLTDARIKLPELVASIVASAANGFSGWTLINRATGLRIDDRHSHSMLAVLVLLGFIQPASDWQASHKLSDGAQRFSLDIIQAYSNYLLCSDITMIKELFVNHSTRSTDVGWVNKDEVFELYSAFVDDLFGESKISTSLVHNEEIKTPKTIEEQLNEEMLKNDFEAFIQKVNSSN
jgi:Sigma-70, region 4